MGWQRARSAAWAEFGRRYWRVIVGLEMARRSAPAVLAGLAVAGIAAGVWWLVTHAPAVSVPDAPPLDVPGRWWWWLIGFAVAVVSALWLAGRRHNPYAPPRKTPRRLAAALAFAALVTAFAVWRS